MPRNKYLTGLLPDKVATLAAHRRFWCGDVFVVKVDLDEEGFELYRDGSISPT